MKNKKTLSIIYYIVAILSYIVALVSFLRGNDNSNVVIWICIGSTFLCLGAADSKKK